MFIGYSLYRSGSLVDAVVLVVGTTISENVLHPMLHSKGLVEKDVLMILANIGIIRCQVQMKTKARSSTVR